MTTYLSPHQYRTFSNKEITPSASVSPTPSVFDLTDIDAISTSLQTSLSGVTPSSKSKKPSGLGIGRAPKFTYRKHATKPYGRERISSIQRAKSKINRLPSSSNNKPKKGLKARPTPLKLKSQDIERARGEEESKKMGVMDRVRLDRWRKSIWKPKPEDGVQGQVRVPLMLPYPKFPAVPPVDNDELRNVPIGYILDKLTPVLPSISTITLAYRPYATIPHPDPSVQPISTLPLAIPEVLGGNKPHWAEKVRGREPDMVLGIMKKGAEGEKDKSKMIVPVMSLVFTTQCAYWPKLTNPPSSSSQASSSNYRTPSEAAVSTALPAIIESPESSDEEETSNTSWSSDSDDDEPSLPAPITDTKGFLHLPIVPLPLPSPETFALIHRHLHHPHRPFIPDLLSLPDTCTTREKVVGELGELSVQQLMVKLEVLQGVWQNLCCLGVGRLSTWRQLGEAWACVVGIIAGNGMLLRDAQQQEGKVRSAAEEVAWDWVRKERQRVQS
ncbi:hypothetical protein I302_105407 [Kwoniella bestiolae CBS 10118]|uniref:Clampless protein 1 n=1 Tax=Kwoniella bestiolae CBS 10118 TaxID=1296100 RepID=A0A1B9FT14_9TREE|nr:hypothetical protein I302_08688 [Kwoniella bestiolae CBS 10118]OCF21909.1 hypothetical protein I302_08688 [Kwoniella bestiolae CBS 10118]